MHLEVELIGVFGGGFLLQCFQPLLLRIEIFGAKNIILRK
jgi:hypothetical protein